MTEWLVAYENGKLDKMILVEIIDSDTKFVRGTLDHTIAKEIADLLNNKNKVRLEAYTQVLNGLKKINRNSHAKDNIEDLLNKMIGDLEHE